MRSAECCWKKERRENNGAKEKIITLGWYFCMKARCVVDVLPDHSLLCRGSEVAERAEINILKRSCPLSPRVCIQMMP